MSHLKSKEKRLEVLFWSCAFPGFGQLLNRKYWKGFILIVLEVIINVMGNVNNVIVYSFLGDIEGAIQAANYQWIMFYSCIYLFAIWDAFKDAGGGQELPFMFIPFVFSAYLGTIGVIYSIRFTIKGHLIGPIFLPLLAMILGFLIGLFLRKIILIKSNKMG